jgi:serine/threonine protein phosphatase PrpC
VFKYATLTDPGGRPEMEDFLVYLDNPRGSGLLYGGVFDGHHGDRVARLCAEKLGLYFLDRLFSSKPRNTQAAFNEAYRQLGLEVAEEISGSCAATFCLDGNVLTTANIGDCRIVVVGRDSCHQLTVDHTPENPEERKRIFEHAGPEKLFQNGPGRLCLLDDYEGGLLQITRSFGDVRFRRSGLTYAPHITEHHLVGREACLIAATDGLFGTMKNEEVAEIARRSRHWYDIPQALAYNARLNDSSDNIAIIMLEL